MHYLIAGVTETGKTTLARWVARCLPENATIIVYDPVLTPTAGGEWPDRAIIFTDLSKFTRYVARVENSETYIFIDEGLDVFGRGDDNVWLLTRGRHKGFSVFVMAQRPKMLPPNVRHMCSRAYIFRLSRQDAKEICQDFGHSDLEKISLDTGDYIYLESGRSTHKTGNIFDDLRRNKRWKRT